MRKGNDAGGQSLLMAVELADLDFGADCGMGDSEPRQSNVLVQHRRAHARCELADLGAADMHAIAMADRHVGVDVEADESLRSGLSLRRISASRPMNRLSWSSAAW
jgi:hypothetical protein